MCGVELLKKANAVVLFTIVCFLCSCTTPSLNYKNNKSSIIYNNSDNSNNYDELWLYRQYHNINHYDTLYADVNANDFIIDGLVLQAQDKHAEAILEFQQAMLYDSTSPAIYYFISKSFLKLEKFDLAIVNLLKSLSFDEKFAPAYDLLTEAYLRKIDIPNAIFASEIANKIEETEERLLFLGKIYEYRNTDKSLKYYKRAAEKYDSEYSLIKILELTRGTQDTLLFYQALKRLFEKNPSEILYVGEIITYFLESHSYSEILDACEKVDSELYLKDLTRVYSYILNIFLQDASIPKKIKKQVLKKIDNRFYSDWKINFLAGNNALSIDDTSNARVFFDRVVESSDTTYDLPLEVFFSYQNYEYKEQSIELLEKFTILNTNNWVYPFYLSVEYQAKNNLDIALKYVLLALERSDSLPEVILQTANIYEAKKDFKNSDKYFKKALLLDPNSPVVNNNYAYSLCNRNENLELALEYSELALKSDSANTAYLDTYGWINYNLGNYYVALNVISKAIELGENNTEVLEHLADIYMRIEKFQESIEIYDKILEIDPDNEKIIQKKETIINNLQK